MESIAEQEIHDDLISGFMLSAKRFPDNTALVFSHRTFTYKVLQDACLSLAALIAELENNGDTGSFSGILSKRNEIAFKGVLASLMRGRAYVPFNLNERPEVLIKSICAISCRLFFVDPAGTDVLMTIFKSLPASTLIFEEGCEIPECLLISQHNCVVFRESDIARQEDVVKKPNGSTLAYVLFTSGSTGEPKAVPITHENASTYVKEMLSLYPVLDSDRCSQAFEFGFDPSVHDMFVTWFAGASLYVMDDKARLGAHYFIKKNHLTIWNSIPSLVKMCLSMRSFNENNLSSLKYVFMNGEPVQQSLVEHLQKKIPQAQIISLYGLTETTVNLAHYCWQSGVSELDCIDGLLPVGSFFPNVSFLDESVDSQELCLTGKQIFSGYLETRADIKEKNQNLFLEHDGKKYLKTGDIFFKDKRGVIHIIGRLDEQVKIKGHRVDLNKVRLFLEEQSHCMDALVLMIDDAEGQKILVGFLKGEGYDIDKIQMAMSQGLAVFQQLEAIFVLEDYPYLISGKVDRVSLREFARKSLQGSLP